MDVPRLYGRDAGKVILHMDSATSQTARKTVNWLNSRGIYFITKIDWLPNIPELSPVDYFGSGHLKQMLKKRQYTTGRGMEEWSKIPLELFQRALLARPKRVHAVQKSKGHRVAL